MPLHLFPTVKFKIFSNTLLEIPVVYELIKKNNGSSESTLVHNSTKSYMFSSNCHTSPFAPLPYDGGSIIIASYLFPLRISLLTNFTTSSTIYLTGFSDKPDDAILSFAHVVIPFELSTWHTDAPAKAHATVAPPVYANKFSTFIFLFEFLILFIIQSQFTACSGNNPVCLKPIGFILNVNSLYFICHWFGTCLLYFQAPPPVLLL